MNGFSGLIIKIHPVYPLILQILIQTSDDFHIITSVPLCAGVESESV